MEILFAIFCIVIVGTIIAVFKTKGETPAPQTDLSAERQQLVAQWATERGDTEALKAMEEGRYDELLEQRAAGSYGTAPYIFSCSIAGINFRKGIDEYVGNRSGYIKPQPTNRHDPNAIAVYASDGHHLGYVPADETATVRQLHMKFPISIETHIEECYDDYEDRQYFVGELYVVESEPSE